MMNAAAGIFLAARRKPKLPYDAEVEYLESTGTQWIDTDVMLPIIGIKATIGCSFPSITAFVDTPILTRPTTAGFSLLLTASNSIKYFWLYNGNGGRFTQKNITFVADRRYDLEAILRPDGATISVDGSSASATFTPNAATENLWIFRQSNRYATGRIFGCKIYSEDILVRDFIPVRFTNELGQSEGAMYDRANPTVGMNPDGSPRTDGLYRNRGTGAFVIGADKN